MLRTRIIPCLQLMGETLVKTVKFKRPKYIGDPINTVRIFNELEVDELCFLDIRATVENRKPNISILKEIADECFMPLAYGGSIRNLQTAQEIFNIGFEKVVLNTITYDNPNITREISAHFGAQSVIGSIDYGKNWCGKTFSYINDGTKKIEYEPVEWAKKLEDDGVGEILLTSINRDGTWDGYDLEITEKVVDAVHIPVIANGGAGQTQHICQVVNDAKASAVALGSMVVYQSKGMGVLVNFPDKNDLKCIGM